VKRGSVTLRPERETVRESGPLDPLEELPPPRSLPLLRHCGRPHCRRFAYPGGRYCRPCATAATRRWRDRHQAEVAARERARSFSPEEQLRRRARAYVDVYVRRGKIEKGRCGICGETEVLAAWDDPARPLDVQWLCRAHADEHRDTAREAAKLRGAIAAEYAEVREQLALLPPDVQAELHEAALRGPAGLGCQPSSPFYWWTLRRELQRYRDRQSGRIFWT
jgi:hypothetical protein